MPRRPGLRIAIVGCGNIGLRGHLPAYARIPDVTLVAVCDADGGSANTAAAVSGASAYTDVGHMLEAEVLDAVDICTPPATHLEISRRAMEAGKHVLCEKPIAHSLQDADAMIEAAESCDVRLMIGQVRRFDQRFVSVKEQIDAGRVGRPVFIRRAERQLLPFPSDAWYWDQARGGGVILDIGVHALDLLRWLFGQEAVEIRAAAKAVRRSAREAGSFDYAMITCRFVGGGIGFAETSWAHPDGFGSGLYGSLDVVGTDGKLEYSDEHANPMLVFDEETGPDLPTYFDLMSTTEYAFESEIAHFLDCIRDDRAFLVDAQDARIALGMASAAHKSALTGRAAVLPDGAASSSDGSERVGPITNRRNPEELGA